MSENLKIYIGPMFSGKTTSLIGELIKFCDIGMKVLLISHSSDDRIEDVNCEGVVTSHSKSLVKIPQEITQLKISFLADLTEEQIESFDVIGIDEAQFFDDLKPAVLGMICLDKMVIVSGLIATSEGTLFGHISELIPYSRGGFVSLTAICTLCMKEGNNFVEATMSKCLVKKDTNILIGSNEYVASCFKHWLN